jgi:adenylate cyclase
VATEIERKFLLRSDAWRDEVSDSERIRQGYLSRAANASVRVRLRGDRAELNVKSTRDGIHRMEYEYEIPAEDAAEMLDRLVLRPLIEKTRHRVRRGDHVWEIDEFFGDNAGLVLAEIELGHAEEIFERPAWLGEEVSADIRYYNTSLSERPYNTW